MMINKIKNNFFLIIIFLTIIMVWGTIGYLIINNKSYNNHVIYSIQYYDDYTPGAMYEISVFKDRIEYTKTSFCSAINCEPTKTSEKLMYSDDNMKKLIKFLNNKYGKTNDIVVHKNELSEREKNIFDCMNLGEYFFELAIEEYKYKLEYYYLDHKSYDIYLKYDDSIVVKMSKINSDYDITNVETFKLDFSKKNMEILKSYIIDCVDEYDGDNNIAYVYSVLEKNKVPIMNSIINNDEKYLKDLDKYPNLIYSINFEGINCLTPVIYLYDDNTYEYYYTFTTGNVSPKPKKGKYDYDINNIIKNNSDNTELFAFYVINDKQNDKSYYIDITNNEINEFFKSINVSLQKCLEQQ